MGNSLILLLSSSLLSFHLRVSSISGALSESLFHQDLQNDGFLTITHSFLVVGIILSLISEDKYWHTGKAGQIWNSFPFLANFQDMELVSQLAITGTSLKSFFEYHCNYTGFYIFNMCFNQRLALASFLIQDFVLRIFKPKESLEELYSEHPYTHRLDSATNISILVFSHVSIYPCCIGPLVLAIFLVNFKVSCRNQYTSP